jgi:hypothetical protein
LARSSSLDAFLRLSAALIGVLPVALYAGLGLARFLPLEPEMRAALGYYSPLPLYALFGCLAARSQSGWRAWAACAGMAALLKVMLVVA